MVLISSICPFSGDSALVLNAEFGGYNTDDTTTMKAPAIGDGTKAFPGPVPIYYDLGAGATMYTVIGSLAATFG